MRQPAGGGHTANIEIRGGKSGFTIYNLQFLSDQGAYLCLPLLETSSHNVYAECSVASVLDLAHCSVDTYTTHY